MEIRTQPEWPETPGQKDVLWEFGGQPATVYDCRGDSVDSSTVKLIGVSFKRSSKWDQRSICISCMEPRARTRKYRRLFDWFYERPWVGPDYQPFSRGDGWLVIAKGYHPLERKLVTSHGGMVHEGYEPISVEAFNVWLDQKKLELFVDFREAAIAEGWRPSYIGCELKPPSSPPPELAHWYPEFEPR